MQDLFRFIQTHSLLASIAAIAVLLLAIIEFMRYQRQAAHISPTKLTQLINHHQAVIIDVRPAAAYNNNHIIGSISIPLAEWKENAKRIAAFKGRPLVLVCAKGVEATTIASSLKKQGLTVAVLQGGIQQWITAGMPLVKATKAVTAQKT